jgi:dTDP-4-dehydrorhamnose reductase
MRKRVAIFGSGGQLGFELCKQFESRSSAGDSWEVVRFDRQSVDITDTALVEAAIARADPQLVVNAAAYNQVDVAENEPLAAFEANALAVRNIALACRQNDARLVHFSTDYVFDGMKGSPYVETDPTHPLGAYAVSKLGGELYAQAYLDRPLVIRVSGVFGPAGMFTPRGNFVESMLRLSHSGKPIRVVEDHFASPTYAPALASRTVDLVEKDASGVFHLGGGEAISWFRYASLIFEAAGLHPELQPSNEREYRTLARRPKFSALSNGKAEAAGIAPMPGLPEALAKYFALRAAVKPHR